MKGSYLTFYKLDVISTNSILLIIVNYEKVLTYVGTKLHQKSGFNRPFSSKM